MEFSLTYREANPDPKAERDKQFITKTDTINGTYSIGPSGALIVEHETDGETEVWTYGPGWWVSVAHTKPPHQPAKVRKAVIG